MNIAGVVLAAGAGTRMGRPKALIRDSDGTSWLARAVTTLTDAGCARVVVVLGADAEQARALVPAQAEVVVAGDWAAGQSASLRAGLAAVAADDKEQAVVITLVDLPDVGAEVVARVTADAAHGSLARAAYDGRPGHPVLLGRDHWAEVAQSATGDQGAKPYLDTHEVHLVECGDLATGRDVDSR